MVFAGSDHVSTSVRCFIPERRTNCTASVLLFFSVKCSDMDFDLNFMVFDCFLFYFSDTIFALVGCHLLCVWSDRHLGSLAGFFCLEV